MFMMKGPPPGQGPQAQAVPPYRPPPGKMAMVKNIYNDPFYWPLTKSVIGFIVGVFVARQISEELNAAGP